MLKPSWVSARMSEYLETTDPGREWLRRGVRTHDLLPLYVGWEAVLGIKPDGSFVRWEYEREPPAVGPVRDPFWQRMALARGVKTYPELRELLPGRPVQATTCDICAGTGDVPGIPDFVCKCGGVGWLVPGEPFEPSPG